MTVISHLIRERIMEDMSFAGHMFEAVKGMAVMVAGILVITGVVACTLEAYWYCERRIKK